MRRIIIIMLYELANPVLCITIRSRAHSYPMHPPSRVLLIMYMRESRYHVFVYSTRKSSFLPCVCLLNKRYLFDIMCSQSKQAK